MSDVQITRVTGQGMITLRGDLNDPRFAEAIGVPMPERRRITDGEVRLAWMSPDECLALCAKDDVAQHLERLTAAFGDQHHLVADVSDARAVFRVTGQEGAVRDVLAKLSPADLRPGSLPKGEVRRTRLAQVAGAFWLDDEGATVICFRSVAQYVEDILRVSTRTPVSHF